MREEREEEEGGSERSSARSVSESVGVGSCTRRVRARRTSLPLLSLLVYSCEGVRSSEGVLALGGDSMASSKRNP